MSKKSDEAFDSLVGALSTGLHRYTAEAIRNLMREEIADLMGFKPLPSPEEKAAPLYVVRLAGTRKVLHYFDGQKHPQWWGYGESPSLDPARFTGAHRCCLFSSAESAREWLQLQIAAGVVTPRDDLLIARVVPAVPAVESELIDNLVPPDAPTKKEEPEPVKTQWKLFEQASAAWDAVRGLSRLDAIAVLSKFLEEAQGLAPGVKPKGIDYRAEVQIFATKWAPKDSAVEPMTSYLTALLASVRRLGRAEGLREAALEMDRRHYGFQRAILEREAERVENGG